MNNDFYSNDNFNQNQNDVPLDDEAYIQQKLKCDSLSTKCMIFGILAISFTVACPCIPSFIFAIISLVLYSKAKKFLYTPKLNGYLIAGMICSIVSLAISLIYLAFMVFYFGIFFMFGFIEGFYF